MKRNDAEQIGKLIRNFLRQESLESPLNERRLISSWAEVLGPTIASYTRELYIKNQVLYVHLTSAAASSGTDDGPGFAGAQSEQARRSAGDNQYYIQIVQPGGGQLSLHSQVMTSSIRMSNVSAGTSSTI